MDSPTSWTFGPNIPNKSSNDNDTVNSWNLNQSPTYPKTQLADQKEKDDAKTLLDNKSSASPLKNNELNNELLQLKDTLKKINQDNKETLAEYSEINNKYKKSLETLFNDHQVNLEINLKILELKIKDIIHEKNNTKVEMQRVIDSLQLELSLKTQQYSNISRQLQNKIEENNKMIQESTALKTNKQQKVEILKEIISEDFEDDGIADLLKTLTVITKFDEDNVPDDLIEKRQKLFRNTYDENQSNLTNKQQEVKLLTEIMFEISQQDLIGSGDLLKTLITILKFNEDNVPDDLLEKRRQFFQNKYHKNRAVVIDDLRKRFDDIALASTNNQFSNRYFCNKKSSYYDSTICHYLSIGCDKCKIDLQFKNLAVIPEDIFTGCENIEKLCLGRNRLYYLESGTFNNLSKLKDLSIDQNHLLSLPKDIFTGLKNLTYLNLWNNCLYYIELGTFNNLSNLQELYINSNNLTALSSDMFNGLEKLEILYISSNKLNSLQPGTFNNLSNLQKLDISHNNLTELSHDIFNGLKKLTSLNLSANKINSLQPGTFNNLSNLKYLLIHQNHLTSLPQNIFTSLKKIEYLNLAFNRLNDLYSDNFDNLPALNRLDIQENNLTTDAIDTFLMDFLCTYSFYI